MKDLKVAIVQTSIYWEKIDLNLTHFETLLKSLKDKADLMILPEMFTTGFSMEPEKLAEGMDGATVAWMRNQAAVLGSVIMGSLIIKENQNHYNRLFWMPPSGNFRFYDKRHLFRMGDEQHHYMQGTTRLIETLEEWRIMPLICYDLRFPVWSRNRNDYDLLIYVANWPEARRDVWKTLLKARALENQAYVIGVNRIGSDGNGIEYSGDSMVIDPKGNVMSTIQPYEEKIEILTLSQKELNEFKEKFPVHLDADEFEIEE